MFGSAIMFAAALSAVDMTSPVVDPRLSAVLSRPATPSLISELERLVAEGVPGADAMHRGFVALTSGTSGPNWTGACPIWETASTTSAEAAHFTAECVEHGHDRPADPQRAAELYRLAGDGGFPKSLCALGNLHMDGRGVASDPVRAADLCRRGAEMGDADAQTDLANFYLLGRGVTEDKVEARRWYERAAEQNQRNALFTLGQMYWNGDTVEKDNDEAARLWRLAYDAGRTDAALPLARAAMVKSMADRNNPNAERLREAERWFDIAIPDISDAAEKAEAEQQMALVRRLLVLLAEREAAS